MPRLAVVRLGVTTTTYDREGGVVEIRDASRVTREEVEGVLADDDVSIIAVRQARLKLISALEEVERRRKHEAPKKRLYGTLRGNISS